jgi:CubicO group peptidase (beta-lactamase class C family)
MKHRALMSLATAGTLLLPSLTAAQQREPYPGMDAYIDAALKAWNVPGMSLAVVRNDSVIYARGYGVREVGKAAPVTARTVFAIGSSSKAFTAAGVAMLADEKKLSLDAPASLYLPGLQLADPYASRELTVRDLLSHRSGLARGDLLWYGSTLDRDEIVRRVRFLQPSWSFRSRFGYQNLMYLAAGQVVAGVAKTNWDDFTRERFFVPLGMTASSTSTKAVTSLADVAQPHAELNEAVRPIPWRNIDNIAPAGSINSNAVDMAQWVRLQLGKGTYGGKRLISERMMFEMHTPHTIIPLDTGALRMNPDTHLQAYGLGWFLQDYRGRLVVQHGGNIDGFSALVAMLPEEKLGLVLLTNMDGSGMPAALMHKLFDLHLGAPARDWSADMLARTQAARARARLAQQRAEAQRVPNTKPSLPLEQYAGVYADSLYGEVHIVADGGALRIDRGPSFQGVLEHWHFDTFQAKWNAENVARAPVTFRLNAAGKVDEVQMDLGGPVTFKRRPAPATASTAR